MRKLLALLLASALYCTQLSAAAAYNASAMGAYQGAGTNSISITGVSGSNLVCVLIVWYRSGAITSPTCGGQAMGAAVLTSTPAAACANDGTILNLYVVTNPTNSGGTVTASAAGSVESAVTGIIFNSAKQSGQPDATVGKTNGTTDGGFNFSLPITTVVANDEVFGVYCNASNNASSPSSNATYIGKMTNGFLASSLIDLWYSTTAVASPGAFNLVAHWAGGVGNNVSAIGISLAPLAGGNIHHKVTQ